jgi:methylphosphotriester-DNA--protein-cysteine methyltransferase
MTNHIDIDSATFRILVRSGAIRLAGNRKLKIYGKLNCRSGKKMKRENRVFFVSEDEALSSGYRACKICKP